MAWPLSSLTSYVAGTTPAIKAFDLNAIQGTIVDTINGEVTLASLTLDGTGGSAVVPTVPGTAKISAVVAGATAPNTSLARGVLGKESVIIGWATINGATGALIFGANCKASARTGAGQYTVDFNPTDAGVTDAGATVTASTGTAASRHGAASYTSGGGFIRYVVGMYDAAGTATDTGFLIVGYAG